MVEARQEQRRESGLAMAKERERLLRIGAGASFADDRIAPAVDLAERLAKLSPDDPELMPELGPQQYLEIPNYFDSTANLSPEQRIEVLQEAVAKLIKKTLPPNPASTKLTGADSPARLGFGPKGRLGP